jgi:hypothetical protein
LTHLQAARKASVKMMLYGSKKQKGPSNFVRRRTCSQLSHE